MRGNRDIRPQDHAPSFTQRVDRVKSGKTMEYGGDVPFVNRLFESEIHGTVNFTQFCCVLLVTWCYRVFLSCYLGAK